MEYAGQRSVLGCFQTCPFCGLATCPTQVSYSIYSPNGLCTRERDCPLIPRIAGPKMIIPYFILSLTLPAALAAGSVCSSGLYAILLPLSAYPPAQSYCSSHFPPSTVTSTSTALGSTSTVVSTTTIPPMKKKLKRHTTSPTPTPKKSPPPTKPTPKPADPQASLFSILVAEAEAVVSTLCSCIETPVTVKVSLEHGQNGNLRTC